MENLQNDLILRVIKGEKVERTPVWMMRQAGRILKEYREVRASVSGFKELVQTPELAAEVTIQPVDLLGVDAAIIFSDILEIPQAMGLPYEMIEKTGPIFRNVIRSEADLKNIHVADPYDLKYVTDAISITKKGLNGRVPLIGFAGAPWTIFCYMVEGKGSKTFSEARKMIVRNPVLSHKLLETITESTILYLKAQIAAGANLVQIFDSWAGILGPDLYREFGLKYIAQICDAINKVPKTVFAKGAFFARKNMKDINCEVVGLDWHTHARASRAIIGDEKTLQGNLDPAILYGSDEFVIEKTIEMMRTFEGKRHIANLGHGVYPDTDPEKVKLFIETVKAYKI
jgi:uroporphyrinogen decarboxylase